MKNKLLKYLLKYNPDKVVSKTGIALRRIISPVFRRIMMLSTKGKLIIKDGEKKENGRKIIYACTHGFHDDIILSMSVANKHTYLVYGNIKDFYNTYHGIGLWTNGVILVDRTDPQSRKSAIKKMIHTINLGGSIIMFPEGTWNLKESLPILELHLGIYEVAKETDSIIIPIATYLDHGINYANKGKPLNITKIDKETQNIIISNNIKLINKCIDLLIYNTNIEKYILNNLLLMIETLKQNKDISKIEEISINLIKEIEENKINTDETLPLFSILERVENILKLISKQEKIVQINKLRDELATLKWNLYTETYHDDFSKDYWKNHIEKLISTTNGFYNANEEKASEYKNPEYFSSEEVFRQLDNVTVTRENAKILKLTKNK